ncbi:hypothetical protein [uncultured Marivita sp.]|uniref:hypothetical protein n=1 Tax=uncultured Marivita sp. TaxID=888080 RepID=UPI002625A60F|nr:hypothetical protein [uncultured Marivita sp.]
MRHLISKYTSEEVQQKFRLKDTLHFRDFRYDVYLLINVISKICEFVFANSFPTFDGKRNPRAKALSPLPIPVHEQRRGSIRRAKSPKFMS